MCFFNYEEFNWCNCPLIMSHNVLTCITFFQQISGYVLCFVVEMTVEELLLLLIINY